MAETSIEWTDKTWNPVVGCTRVSPGCEHCYAETMASRQVLMSVALGRRSPYLRVVDADNRRWTRAKDVKADPANHQHVELLPERLNEPLSFKPGTRVFVCSMSDIFHEHVPFEFIARVWAVMASRPDVIFQVLTKRTERMALFVRRWVVGHVNVLPNVWLGTSVEDQQRADERIPLLLAAPAAVRFLSAEPLLGPLDLGRWLGDYDCHSCGARFWGREVRAVDRLVSVGSERDPSRPDDAEAERDVCPRCGQPDIGTGDVGPVGGDYEGQPTIDWVIVGGESGPGARPMDPSWVRSLSNQCHIADAAFFFKQWGGARKKQAGRELDGRTHDAMPGVSHG